MAVFRTSATGGGAINFFHAAPVAHAYQVASVTCKFSAAPATAGTFAITLDCALGAEYDVTLYSVDPSVSSVTSIVWMPTSPMYLAAGDAVRVTYTNADLRTYGLVVTTRSD